MRPVQIRRCRRAGSVLAAALSLLLMASVVRAAESPPPLEAYGQLPAMENLALSPSGERVAFAANGKNGRRLYIMTLDGKPLAAPALGDRKLRSVSWAGEQFVVVGTSDTYNLGWEYGFRHELSSYQAIDLAQNRITPLLGGTRTLATAFGDYGLFEHDQHWYAYLGALPLGRSALTGDTYLTGSPRNLVEVDLASGKQRTAVTGCENCSDWLLGTGGQLLASAEYDDRKSEWRLYAGRRERLLLRARDPYGRNTILGEGRRAGTVLYRFDDAQGNAHLMEIPLAGGQPIEVLATANVQDLIWDPATHLLSGYVGDDDARELVPFDAHRAARLHGTRKAFPGLGVQFVSWSNDFDRLIVYTEGGRQAAAKHQPAVDGDAGTYWFVDISSGKASDIGRAYPQVPSSQVGPWRVVPYRAADGLALEGMLTLPPNRPAKSLPLVVLPHGGPEARDYPRFDWWAQAFASRGYAVWQPNFRGSTGYGSALRNAGRGQWGAKMQTDIADGVAELARQGIVNPRRSCIVGGSYGGYAALAGATLQNGLYRCAVSYAGIADLEDQLLWRKKRFGEDAMRDRLRWLGARAISDELVRQRSPISHVEDVDAPILLIHGKDDTIVPYAQSVRMQRALQAAGKSVELLTLDGEDHWLSRSQTRTAMLKAAVAFVQRHNPADPP